MYIAVPSCSSLLYSSGYENTQFTLHGWHFENTGYARRCLRALTTDATGELDVLWHDGDSLSVDGTQVGVFEQSDKVSFSGFLESKDGRSLETQITLKVLSNFAHETLERKLANEQIRGFLIASNLTQSDRTGTVL